VTHPTRSIEELVDKLIDYRGKTPPKTSSGIRLVTAKVIKEGFIQDDRVEFIADDYYDTWMRRGLPRRNDILMTTEAPLGEVAQIRTNERIALAQRVILLRGNPKLINQNYFFQALKSPDVQARLRARSTGTTVLGIKQSELRQVQIPCPPRPTQDRIANILSAYDDLIENNTRRIKILEETAQRIYREWFVRFRFPGHENVPLVPSDLGPIPQGWEPTTVGDLGEEKRRSVDPTEVAPETPYVGLEHIPRRSFALSEWSTIDGIQSTKLRFKAGEILFGKIRPYFHKVVIAPVDGVTSTDTIVISALRSEHRALLLNCVFSDDFVAQATQTSQGTKMPRANWGVLQKYPCSLPPRTLLSSFNAAVEPMVELTTSLTLRSRNLRTTRDLLLPKLISGEISVEAAADVGAELMEQTA